MSRAAYSLLSDLVPNGGSRSVPDEVIFMSLQAETTSLAARSAVTYGLAVPTFALARVRLEQCIVFSFLAHVPKLEGWDRYVADIAASAFEVKAKAEARTRPSTRTRPHLHEEIQDLEASAYIDKSGKFKRTWTKLSVREMAKRRDMQARILPIPWNLTDEYWDFYPLTSLAVHGASETMLWNSQLHEPHVGAGTRYPYMLPWRARHIMAAIARYDIIQAFETLASLSGPSATDLDRLLKQYDEAANKEG